MTVFDQRGQTVKGVQLNAGGTFVQADSVKLYRVVAYGENSNTIVLLESGDFKQAEQLYKSTPTDRYVYVAIQESVIDWRVMDFKQQ